MSIVPTTISSSIVLFYAKYPTKNILSSNILRLIRL